MRGFIEPTMEGNGEWARPFHQIARALHVDMIRGIKDAEDNTVDSHLPGVCDFAFH